MRKIESNLIAAIKAGKSYSVDNTSYNHNDGTVRLHDNLIARIGDSIKGDKFAIEFCLAGWNTPTTRSRINALAREFGHAGVHNVRSTPYTGDVRVTSTQWF